MNELISVIVPIYNTENYVSKCIESLVNQTYQNLEIILVDDGSTDSSLSICNDSQSKDYRIKVIHKENGGVSSARNVGMKNATGMYLCFCDSDDWYSNDAISIMSKAMDETDADLCCFGRYGGAFENKQISKKDNPHELLNYLTSVGSYGCMAKMFKTEIIKLNNLFFDESFAIAEDTLWLREYILHSNEICLRTDKIYFVEERPGSLTRTPNKIYPDSPYYFKRKLEVLKRIVAQLPISDYEKENFLCERAIHGIKTNSLNYISDCHNNRIACKYIKNTLYLLKPWLKLGKVNNKELDEWYQKNKKFILKENVNGLYYRLIPAYYIRTAKNKIGKVFKVKR